MDALALAFSSGWGSGINAYLVVLVLGFADRVHPTSSIPDGLANPAVLGVALALFVVEFVADKIPVVDSAWDTVSTVIRPTVGAVVGVLIAGEADSLNAAVGGVVGGGTALASHAVKMGTRLAVNTSPEPFSNVALSVGEDAGVLGIVWFAIEHPVPAAIIAAVLLVTGLGVLYLAARTIRRGWRRLRDRRATGPVRAGPPR